MCVCVCVCGGGGGAGFSEVESDVRSSDLGEIGGASGGERVSSAV